MVAFGTNEWLVDEIYQQYLKDPQTVDRAWWDFFADYRPGDPATPNGPTGAATTDADLADGGLAIGDALKVVDPPRPSAQPGQPDPAQAAGTRHPTRRARRPSRHRPTRRDRTSRAATTASHRDPPGRAPARRRPELAHTVPATEVEAPATTFGPVAPQANPSTLPSGPIGSNGRDSAPRVLQGPSARVVTNMEASLEVPTATSVRAMPAKLLIDNRLIINNQLARGRGGKVSFTHLIGYALVKALSAMPEMNVGFTRGRRASPRSIAHPAVNLGLAIDLDQARRHAPAPRPVHQGAPSSWTSRRSGPPTRSWSARPGAAPWPPTTSPGRPRR